ncbi:zeta toxin family protein [Campylobacter ureolyticus]|uniref:zeta toxin family protein n=1 Tax=Campylobacter ureolyticus TaxID=827 RepID=UPI0022B4F33D|nr:zeta toxin family protein [Campylobacter ureolyticus]MCZ6135690.1 zeta toxin family protein [Campylobacter ureolyticus]
MDIVDNLVRLKFNLVWNAEILNKSVLKKSNNPKGYILGGQPGAGKSELLKQIRKKHNKDVVIINADDYRKYHPNYKEFQENFIENSPKYTALFSAKMTEAIIKKALDERYNIAIEGTFRTSETPINTLKILKEAGYKTIVAIQTCDKEISWKSCLERYNKALKINPLLARYTDKNHHDLVVKNLAKNIKEVQSSGLVDNLKIFTRTLSKDNTFEQKLIFDSSIDKNLDIKVINKYLGVDENLQNCDVKKEIKKSSSLNDNFNTYKLKI